MRRIAWHNYAPSNFNLMSMHIAQWETAQRDDASMDTPAKIAAMQADKSNHSYVY